LARWGTFPGTSFRQDRSTGPGHLVRLAAFDGPRGGFGCRTDEGVDLRGHGVAFIGERNEVGLNRVAGIAGTTAAKS